MFHNYCDVSAKYIRKKKIQLDQYSSKRLIYQLQTHLMLFLIQLKITVWAVFFNNLKEGQLSQNSFSYEFS